MKFAIFGTGGVGGYFGGRLAQAREDVTFIARGHHLSAIQQTGLSVDSIRSDFVVNPAKATDSTQSVGAVDVVNYTPKSTSSRSSLSTRPMLCSLGRMP